MIQTEEQIELEDEYFHWMYHLVCNDKRYSKVSYYKLFKLLNSIVFYPIVDMDENRRADGIYLRYHFGYNNGYSNDYIEKNLDNKDCSVLEMIIALAVRIEEQIMTNPLEGDRTGQWFWNMILSMGCNFNDENFYERTVIDIVNNFLERNYSYDGKGGLFTLNDPPEDLRNVEIWCQCNWYINEHYTWTCY